MLESPQVSFARAIADDTRQHIMKQLCCRWLSVGDVVNTLDGRVNQPTVSHHLKKLEEAGLVQVRQQGRQRFYTLDQSRVTLCCGQLVLAFAPDFVRRSQGEQTVNDPIIPIHAVVQDRYGTIAATGSGACCGPDGCNPTSPNAQLYEAALTADLPASVTDISLGCGDPVTIAGLQPGEWVLDLGSGGGIDCFLAARQVGDSGYVIGIDMTPAMLRRANENKARLGAHNVEFRRGHIEALPVVPDSIDVIMSNCVINLSPDKAAVFREALRVLRPGGRISVSDIVAQGEFSPEMRADSARWAECVTGAISVEDYTELMRQAGFVDVQVIDQSDAEGIVERQPGMPRLFSARITARKPVR